MKENKKLTSPLNNHTVTEIQQKAAVLNAAIQALVLAFQADTGCLVHSIPVHQDKAPTRTQIKVQIPGD